MAAAMGGVDVVAFAGGIGERSPEIRARICRELGFLGVQIDGRANTEGPAERRISEEDASVGVYVIPTDEEAVVAKAVAQYLAET